MTARYRCPYCGKGKTSTLSVRDHLMKQHRKAILSDLRVIEAYGTRGETLTRSEALERRARLHSGVSGEGDSS